jgi:HKD family nuclease
MPTIFDNISEKLAPILVQALQHTQRADFCVGYFNLRGWKLLADEVEPLAGTTESRVRLLVGMQTLPNQELKDYYRFERSWSQNAPSGGTAAPQDLDNATARRWQHEVAKHFKEQLTYGVPTANEEAALKRLSQQIKDGKVVVKLSVRQGLHAKLYLLHRSDPFNPIIAYLGSSNLTLAGLHHQGELNVDVLERDAAQKLAGWFEDRWNDRWSIDISQELVDIIDSSWAGESATPHQIYIKMAYELSREARAGLSEYNVPKDFQDELFDYQKAAVSIAAHRLYNRGGVVLGDVVGLGKTLMATTLAKIFEEDYGFETLILCPKNLVTMWRDYAERYRLSGTRIMSTSRVLLDLPELRRFRVVVIDESHNLRNAEGLRYGVIKDYINQNDSRCILLSATPYNKTYLDLSSQLRLFIKEDTDLGIRPEAFIRAKGEHELGKLQLNSRSIKAFEKSEYPDDWRELMRLFMVRRTRSFIQNNYTKTENGRKYLEFSDGRRSYFPTRIPRTVSFQINDNDPNDPYARLYAPEVVNTVENLVLPRYGLGNYIIGKPKKPPTPLEQKQIQNLGRAGKRLIGFCRTNLFKRLESGGTTFIQSLERHVLRNYVFLYALEHDLPLPIGSQNAELLDSKFNDQDSDDVFQTALEFVLSDETETTEEDFENTVSSEVEHDEILTAAQLEHRAAAIYNDYVTKYAKRFKWLRSGLFSKELKKDLQLDCDAILGILSKCGVWNPDRDAKLNALQTLITKTHPKQKVLVFTQFADTVHYLTRNLKARGVTQLEGAVGSSSNPTALAHRFSPRSNDKKVTDELRVLIATDVLSEGQNLQDAHIVVNFDLPWAIIRLIQRAGRVDRIGQQAESILCYSFLPAEGVERIINLRKRVNDRLRQNAEVVGTDEQFFEDEDPNIVIDVYNEKSGLLDGEADTEIDLSSYAFQIWKNAIEMNPKLKKIIEDMPNVVYAARAQTAREVLSREQEAHTVTPEQPKGVLVYARTAQGNDALAWMDENGNSVSHSQKRILDMAACEPNTKNVPRAAEHHELVAKGIALIAEDENTVGGQLGKPSGARYKTYERLKRYAEQAGLFGKSQALSEAIDEIYRFPLRQSALDTLNRQLKSGITDAALEDLVLSLHQDKRLCVVQEDGDDKEPQIICSLGLV